MKRKQAVVVSLVGAAFLTLIVGLWGAGTTGDIELGIAGVGLSLCVLCLAFEAEGS